MPSSSISGKALSIAIFDGLGRATPINRVIDVGVGHGTYLKLLRPAVPGPRWTGIEAWAPYIARFQLNRIYDQIVVADVRFVDFRKLPPAELMIFGDILEHMSKEQALAVIGEALTHCRFVLASIPVVAFPQEAFGGNPFEAHIKSDWSDAEARESFPCLAFGAIDHEIGVYWMAREPADMRLLADLALQVVRRFQATGRWTEDLGI